MKIKVVPILWKKILGKSMLMEIEKISIKASNGPDEIEVLVKNMPSPMLGSKNAKLTLKFVTTKGWGLEYVRKNFKMEPEIHLQEK